MTLKILIMLAILKLALSKPGHVYVNFEANIDNDDPTKNLNEAPTKNLNETCHDESDQDNTPVPPTCPVVTCSPCPTTEMATCPPCPSTTIATCPPSPTTSKATCPPCPTTTIATCSPCPTTAITTQASCPGFIRLEGSSQCFKFFNDKMIKWGQAKSLCESHQLQLAEPADDIAVELRKYLLDMHGNGIAWLGARGDGSFFRWQSNGGVLPNDSPLWAPGLPGSRITNFCLQLLVHEHQWKPRPTHPYYPELCTFISFTLCERVLG